MTAEIGILNRQGVALAADSAVTVSINGKEKILNSANKLFNLIKGKPVGFMVYGNGSFMGLPWDIIVNSYRNNFNNEETYSTLEYICNNFLHELSSNPDLYTESTCNELIYSKMNTCLSNIILFTQEKLSERYPNIQVQQNEVSRVFEESLDLYIQDYTAQDFSVGFDQSDYDYIYSMCEPFINRLCESSIMFSVTTTQINKLKSICALLMTKNILFNYSGIVIAGYGDDEILPKLFHYKIEGIVNDKLKYNIEEANFIDASDFNGGNTAAIVPFAQQEMVHSILSGMDPYLQDFILYNLSQSYGNIVNNLRSDNEDFNNQLNVFFNNEFETLRNLISGYQYENFVTPILNMVAMLNKDELATMAENLVNITSFKRKFTTDTETVGGPIDVAVISKSDGFIWIKRKHYFKSELNHTYFNINNY